jgi:tetratricopeptide (TPR) repeat protein
MVLGALTLTAVLAGTAEGATSTTTRAVDALAAARDHYVHGRYREAEALYAEAEQDPRLAARAHEGLAEVYSITGQYDRADSACQRALAIDPGRARAANIAGEVHFLRGRHAEAAACFERAARLKNDRWRAQFNRAALLETTGRFEDADRLYGEFIDLYNRSTISDAETLVLIGLASTAYNRRHRGVDMAKIILNDLFLKAAKQDRTSSEAHLAAGLLLLDKYNTAEAEQEFGAVLKINPNHPDAHLGLALAAAEEHPERIETHVDAALRVNPAFVPGHLLRAWLAVMTDDYPAAEAALALALRTNPKHLEAMSLRAAVNEQTGRCDECAADLKSIAAINGRSALPYEVLGQVAEGNRRFADAERHYQRAIELEPYLPDAHTNLGLLYMRAGREAEAEPVLAKASRLDPYNAKALRVKRLLQTLKSFQVVESEHFILKFDAASDGVLGHVAPAVLEQVYAEVCGRFGYAPPGKTLVEIFPNHTGFSVRTSGKTWIGTIGASTGWVVAMASPRIIPGRRVDWVRVLVHEFTHVVTLRATEMQMPHWFTEALAVTQESPPPNLIWIALLTEALAADRLIPVADLDRAFVRPGSEERRQLAYAESAVIAEMIRARYDGDATMRRILAAFKTGARTPEVIRTCLALDLPAFDRVVRAYVGERVSQAGVVPWKGGDPESLRAELARRPGDADLAARLAWALLTRGDARGARREAAAALQTHADHPSARSALGAALLALRDFPAARKTLDALLASQPDDPHALFHRAQAAVELKDYAAACADLERLQPLTPLDARVALLLARVYGALDRPKDRVTQLERAVQLGEDASGPARTLAGLYAAAGDFARAADAWGRVLRWEAFDAGAYTSRADCLRELGQTKECIAALEAALAVDPRHAAAREMLDGLSADRRPDTGAASRPATAARRNSRASLPVAVPLLVCAELDHA